MRIGLRDDPEEVLQGRLRTLLLSDPGRLSALRAHRTLHLPDGWIGAGFVRNAVWDRLHDRPAAIRGDIDVVWFDPARTDVGTDSEFSARLSLLAPGLDWSVRNQARMHRRNNDAPYRSVADALRFWPETATAVAVRLTGADEIEVLAPFGLSDLFALCLRPMPPFRGARYPVFEARVRDRNWLAAWPGLRLMPPVRVPDG